MRPASNGRAPPCSAPRNDSRGCARPSPASPASSDRPERAGAPPTRSSTRSSPVGGRGPRVRETASEAPRLLPPVPLARRGGARRDGHRLALDGPAALSPHESDRRRPRRGDRVGDPRVRGIAGRGRGPVSPLARLALSVGASGGGGRRPAPSLRGPPPSPPRAHRQERLFLLLGVRVQRDRPVDGAGPAPRRLREAPPAVGELRSGEHTSELQSLAYL